MIESLSKDATTIAVFGDSQACVQLLKDLPTTQWAHYLCSAPLQFLARCLPYNDSTNLFGTSGIEGLDLNEKANMETGLAENWEGDRSYLHISLSFLKQGTRDRQNKRGSGRNCEN